MPCRRFRDVITFVVLVAIFPRPGWAREPVEAPLPTSAIISRIGHRYVQETVSGCLVVGISSPQGRRVWGFADAEASRIPNGDTLFEIGSITKTMTGTVLAELVIRGQARLDDPVRDYFPDDWIFPRRDDRDISLLHLATHTSSLPRMPPDFLRVQLVDLLTLSGSWSDPYAVYDLGDLKASLAGTELSRPIGSEMAYSNYGVGILGLALARAAGQEDPAPLFETILLEPLGMRDTHFEIPPESRSRLAPPYQAMGMPGHVWHFKALKACGGLRSSASDLLRYGDAATGRIETPLQPAFESALQRWREIDDDRYIGLGWFVRPVELPGSDDETTTLAWHNGGTGGYRSFIAILPEHEITLVMLANTTRGLDSEYSWPILEAILGGI